jgi:hypothetical protein
MIPSEWVRSRQEPTKTPPSTLLGLGTASLAEK